MRITHATLVDLARREVERRADGNGVLAAYLIGSVVHDRALLGGAADIDLVLIHRHPPALDREIVALSEDVHLDIAHHGRERYSQPRELRLDPWLGPAIYDPLPLHDPEHFFEWAQASARGQFLRADHRLARADAFLQRARGRQNSLDPQGHWVGAFARAAYCGANAIATLAGQPAAGRRALPHLETSCSQVDCPQAYRGLMRLLGAEAGLHDAAGWVAHWARAFDDAAPLTGDPGLLPERRAYYLKGFQALLDSGEPHTILLNLLLTWDPMVQILESFEREADHLEAWTSATAQLGLSLADAPDRLIELDSYLDHLEAFLEAWSERHGA